MTQSPTVSVIIPTYGGAVILPEAIRSVLGQTFEGFEIVVVDDCSPDNTTEVVQAFGDPRIKYLRNNQNQGAFAARRTGVSASKGRFIAFLDQDDIFHPEKLACHVQFLNARPEVGSSCNARFNVEFPSKKILGIWNPPENVSLSDLILGFPISPSDAVVRREWALREDVWDDSFARRRGSQVIFNGGEFIIWGRMALSGCRIENVGRVLNYRRYHEGRILSDLIGRCEAERRCQELILSDARCPEAVRRLSWLAFSETFLVWIYSAFSQGEPETGRTLLRNALEEFPALSYGTPPRIVDQLFRKALSPGAGDGGRTLRAIFQDLPIELRPSKKEQALMEGHVFLTVFCRNAIWNRSNPLPFPSLPSDYIPGDEILSDISHQLHCYELAYGAQSAEMHLQSLARDLKEFFPGLVRRVRGRYHFNRALAAHRENQRFKCFRTAVKAVFHDATYLGNRGLYSLLLSLGRSSD